MVIKSVGVISVAKMLGAMYAAIGLLAGLAISLVALFGGMAAMQSELGVSGGVAGAVLGIGSIVIFPLLYGGMGFIGGALLALIYNIFAGVAGGIRFEVDNAPLH